jgi:hypothetical protein
MLLRSLFRPEGELSMNRRKFMASTGVAIALSSSGTSAAAASGQRVLMKSGMAERSHERNTPPIPRPVRRP